MPGLKGPAGRLVRGARRLAARLLRLTLLGAALAFVLVALDALFLPDDESESRP